MENRRKPASLAATLDINCDCKEYVLDYLAHSFPVQLYEPYTDASGNVASRPVFRDGQPVECRDAIRRREAMIERLAALPAGLDQREGAAPLHLDDRAAARHARRDHARTAPDGRAEYVSA